jgi:phosphohistidine phosphatase
VRVYFLRHGIAGERRAWRGDDAERPLTKQGIERMRIIAAALTRLDLSVDAIITSPLVRAKETAEIVAHTLQPRPKTVEDTRLAPGFDARTLRAILRDHPYAGTVMVVGHEPDFSETISALIGGGHVAIKKGGLARVDLPDAQSGRGELVWLVPPRVLAR